MTYKEKKDYLKEYKLISNLIRRFESKEKFFALNSEEEKEKQNFLWKTEKVREEVSLMPDPILREIIYQKYIEGVTFEDLAEILGYSARHVQRLHKVAVEEFHVL